MSGLSNKVLWEARSIDTTEGLWGFRKPLFTDLSFSLLEGQIYGVFADRPKVSSSFFELLMGKHKIRRGELVNRFDAISSGSKMNTSPSRVISVDRGVLFSTPKQRVVDVLISQLNSAKVAIDPKVLAGSFKEFGIEMRTKVGDLSQRDKVLFVSMIILLQDPDLIMLYQPWKDLSHPLQQHVKQQILGWKGKGKCILIVSDHINFIEEICDRYILFNNYRLLYPSKDSAKPDPRVISFYLKVTGVSQEDWAKLLMLAGIGESACIVSHSAGCLHEIELQNYATAGQLLNVALNHGVILVEFRERIKSDFFSSFATLSVAKREGVIG